MADDSKNGNGFVGQLRNNSALIIITVLTNLFFIVFWFATLAARINVTEAAIEANKAQIANIQIYLRDFASRVDRQETPLARRVVELERLVEILDNRFRALPPERR